MLPPSATAVDAFHAQLVTGGYPRLLRDLAGHRLRDWLRQQFDDDASPLLVTGERILAGEFPDSLQARAVLTALGAGERTFSGLAGVAGLPQASLHRSLHDLGDAKRVVARDVPTGPGAPNVPRYRIADQYLRFWLRFCLPALPDVLRQRGDLAFTRWESGWAAYRGKAVEPLVHQALARLAADDERLGGAGYVGGWWNRANNPEVDIVGVDRSDTPRHVSFTGTVKWRTGSPLGERDIAAHRSQVGHVPALAGAPVIGVTAGRSTATSAHAVFTAGDLLTAWAVTA